MPFEFNDASVLDCIAKIAERDDLSREYKILLVAPQILGEVAKLERIGNYRVKAYMGNDEKQNGFFSTVQNNWDDNSVKTRELSVIISEESSTLPDYMTHMQFRSRFEIKKPRLLMFNKEHYEKGTSGLRENLRGHELDLTKNSFRMREILGYFED